MNLDNMIYFLEHIDCLAELDNFRLIFLNTVFCWQLSKNSHGASINICYVCFYIETNLVQAFNCFKNFLAQYILFNLIYGTAWMSLKSTFIQLLPSWSIPALTKMSFFVTTETFSVNIFSCLLKICVIKHQYNIFGDWSAFSQNLCYSQRVDTSCRL